MSNISTSFSAESVRICKGPNYQKFVTDLKAGEYLGEISLIDNMPRSASAVALTDVLVIEIDKNLFNQAHRFKSQSSAGNDESLFPPPEK